MADLVVASFRGVEFNVETEAISEAGRKLVLHEYPNSDIRNVEDLGRIPEKFSVSAYINSADNQEWKNQEKRLRDALNEPGVGRLVLPSFGSFLVYAEGYSTRTAVQRRLGDVVFDMRFVVGDQRIGPQLSTVDIQSVYTAGDTARQNIQSAFANNFIVKK